MVVVTTELTQSARWGRVFLTALVDANNNGVVDTGEYEYLILDFT